MSRKFLRIFSVDVLLNLETYLFIPDNNLHHFVSVYRVLWHTNITTTQKYTKITTEKIDKDLTMLATDLINRLVKFQ